MGKIISNSTGLFVNRGKFNDSDESSGRKKPDADREAARRSGGGY